MIKFSLLWTIFSCTLQIINIWVNTMDKVKLITALPVGFIALLLSAAYVQAGNTVAEILYDDFRDGEVG